MSKIVEQKYELVDVDRLKPHPDNPNQGDVGSITTSLERNGFYGAVLVQKSSERIIAGHHRIIAAQQDGLTQVPVIWMDVDDVTARRILLADNRTAELATKDENALAALLKTIAEQEGPEGLAGTGYDGDDLDSLLADYAQEGDAATETPPESWQVVIECANEQQQSELLERLQEEGLDCRALVG